MVWAVFGEEIEFFESKERRFERKGGVRKQKSPKVRDRSGWAQPIAAL